MSEEKKVPETVNEAAANPILAKIQEFNGNSDIADALIKMGVKTLEDMSILNETDLIEAKMSRIDARKLLASLAPQTPAAAGSAPSASPAITAEMVGNILPDVPDDGSWLTMLKTGGVLKVDQSTVIATIRAALATRVGLYEVPEKLVNAMEAFADESEEQVNPIFYKLRNQLTRRSYAEVFEAIDGLDGNFVTKGRKKQLIDRIDSGLWQAIGASFQQLTAWQQNWLAGAANPTAFMAMMVSGGGTLPPGLMSPPDTGALRDAGDEINNAINRVFAGTGVQIAAALAYEASEIRKTLENPQLPAMIGANNRDMMLKKLGVSVSANYARLETNLVKYVLSFISIGSVAAGNEEYSYFSALWALGNNIDWGQLGIGGSKIGVTSLTGQKL